MLKALFKQRYVISVVHKTCYLSEKEISLIQHHFFLANLAPPLLIISLFPTYKKNLCLIICCNIFPAIQVKTVFSAYTPQAALLLFFLNRVLQSPVSGLLLPRCCGKGSLQALGLLQPVAHVLSVGFWQVWLTECNWLTEVVCSALSVI